MTGRSTPPRWWTATTSAVAAVSTAICAVVLWTFFPPLVFYPVFVLASACLAAVGLLWFVLAAIGWFRYRAIGWSLAAPAVVLLSVVLVFASVPPRAAFAVSEGSLVSAAQTCEADSSRQQIGVYTVWNIRPIDGGCLFYIVGGLLDSNGLAYLPDRVPYLGEPRRDGMIGYERWDTDWYSFVQRF